MYKCFCWRSTGYEREIYGKSTGDLREMLEQHIPSLKTSEQRRFKRFTGYLQYISIVQR